MWVFLILEPARLLGACKPGSQARMDSRTGHKLVPSKKIGVSDGLGLQECMATINYGQEDELQVTPFDFWIETDLCV